MPCTTEGHECSVLMTLYPNAQGDIHYALSDFWDDTHGAYDPNTQAIKRAMRAYMGVPAGLPPSEMISSNLSSKVLP
jgi:hypothetical protein